jgi:hypothetical protein
MTEQPTTTARALLNDPRALSDLLFDCVNAFALVVQNKIGVTDGGVAGIFFSGGEVDEELRAVLVRYLETEALYEDEEEASQ